MQVSCLVLKSMVLRPPAIEWRGCCFELNLTGSHFWPNWSESPGAWHRIWHHIRFQEWVQRKGYGSILTHTPVNLARPWTQPAQLRKCSVSQSAYISLKLVSPSFASCLRGRGNSTSCMAWKLYGPPAPRHRQLCLRTVESGSWTCSFLWYRMISFLLFTWLNSIHASALHWIHWGSFSWAPLSTQRMPLRLSQIYFLCSMTLFLFFCQCPHISFLWCISYWSYFKLMSVSSLPPSPPQLCSKRR